MVGFQAILIEIGQSALFRRLTWAWPEPEVPQCAFKVLMISQQSLSLLSGCHYFLTRYKLQYIPNSEYNIMSHS